MPFKIDENLPVEVAAILVQAGHDAVTIHDQKMVPLLASETLIGRLWILDENNLRIREGEKNPDADN